MNTEELKVNLKKDYGIHYSKAEVLEAMESFFKDKPYLLFDMIVEAGLKPMIAIMKECVACHMMEEQKKELQSQGSLGEAVSFYDECDDLLLDRYY